MWKTQQDKVKEYVKEFMSAVIHEEHPESQSLFDENILRKAFKELKVAFDPKYGGFGTRPKFPTPHRLMFLLRFYARTKDKGALEMVTKTLDTMHLGGIYDHVGYGFHRYSTDRRWHLPHFEKMLYDQALIALAYIEAYQITKKQSYKEVVKEIFDYVVRQLQSPEGGFYSSEDADSEGEEGKFYVWTYKELKNILSSDEFGLFRKIFEIEPDGNFQEEATRKKTGKKLLHMRKSLDELAKELQIHPEKLKEKYEVIKKKLFAYREKRVHPAMDTKIIIDWNGLMIAALAKAGAVFNNQKFIETAKKTAEFIIKHMPTERQLYHRYKDGEWAIEGFFDDYAFFIWGLLELYESTFQPEYLKIAVNLTKTAIDKFWDFKNQGFFFVSEDARETPVRNKELYDGAIPSGNSVMTLNLLKISSITTKTEFQEIAEKNEKAFSTQIESMPSAHSFFLIAVDYRIGPTHELVIVDKSTDKIFKKAVETINEIFLPRLVTIFKTLTTLHLLRN